MPIESAIYQALTTSTTLTALTTNIFPVKQRQGSTSPAVVYRREYGERLYSLAGYVGTENPNFSIDIYSTSLDSMRLVTDAVINALSSSTFAVVASESPSDEWSDEVEQYVRTLSISIWNNE